MYSGLAVADANRAFAHPPLFFHFPGGAFEGVEDQVSPFGHGRGEGVDAGHGDPDWICSKDKPYYDEIFKSLNPIDGKVTGAGNYLSISGRRDVARFTHRYPYLRGSLTYHTAMEMLLRSTHNCNLLAELCLSVKLPDGADARFDKIVDALSVTAQSCHLMTRFLVREDESSRGDEIEATSSDVSVHSLPIEDTRASTPKRAELEQPFDVSDSDDDITPQSNLCLLENNRQPSVFEALFDAVKVGFLIITSAFMVVFLANFLFIVMVYTIAGRPYLEFQVDRVSGSWMDHARSLAFGPEKETLRVATLADLFLPKILWRILKQFFRELDNNIV